MELALLFYFADVVDNMQFFLLVPSILSLIGGALALLICIVDEDVREQVKPFKAIPIVAMVVLFISLLLPSKQTVYTMAAAYGVQSVAENPDVKRLAGKSLQVIEKALDDYMPKEEAK